MKGARGIKKLFLADTSENGKEFAAENIAMLYYN